MEFKKIENIYKVTVNFVSEIITCVKDKNNKIIEGNPDTIKIVNDVWKFSKNMWSRDPTWYLSRSIKQIVKKKAHCYTPKIKKIGIDFTKQIDNVWC